MSHAHRAVLLLVLTGIFALALLTRAGAADKSELPLPKQDLAGPKDGETAPRTAVFASGCFWCTEAVFEELEGVHSAVSGYTGGKKGDANYEVVSSGRTAHAEAVRVTYDPKKITYARLLQVFFATHDPTTKDRQGPDKGRQYRSAVFYENEEQKKVAEAYIKQLTEAKAFGAPIVTTLEPLTAFYPAEDDHQDYVKGNPFSGYVREIALPKVRKVREQFKEDLKKGEGKKK
jgi:methionine-S-sulfoxide reductase